MPPASEDVTGRSASSEGDIANHNPFNALADFIPPKKEEPEEQKQIPAFNPPQQQQQQQQQQQRKPEPKRKKKTIIYSDKSESSVDEMMADTPSNYNIPNGRLDGKSLGLKAILL